MTGAESLSPEPTFARALLTDMIRVRRMEEKCAEMYSAGKIRGFLHLYVGEEAVAAGSLRVLAADDAVIATYREHAHALLRGIPMTTIMAEMFGKQEGCSGGRGGSMHLFDAGRRFYGGNAVDYIEAALSAQGRKLVVVDDAEVDDDLVRDMTEILTSFCARLYGKRAAANRAARMMAAAAESL